MKLNRTNIFVSMLLLAAVTVSTLSCGGKGENKESDKKFTELEKIEKALEDADIKIVNAALTAANINNFNTPVAKGKADLSDALKKWAKDAKKTDIDAKVKELENITPAPSGKVKALVDAAVAYLKEMSKEKK